MRSRLLALLSAAALSAPVLAGDPYTALVASMQEKNGVGLERLRQTPLQAACSNPGDRIDDPGAAEAMRRAAGASVKLPPDGQFLGDWQRGAAIAAEGKGLQYSDDPAKPNGGNCYACHQLDPDEVAYGTIGPSLTGYGARGQSRQVLEYTWAKLWNPHASVVCSHMPRFGDAGILTEQQIRDVMAYLLDPASPVNRRGN